MAAIDVPVSASTSPTQATTIAALGLLADCFIRPPCLVWAGHATLPFGGCGVYGQGASGGLTASPHRQPRRSDNAGLEFGGPAGPG